jgi:PAS domain-containing protein
MASLPARALRGLSHAQLVARLSLILEHVNVVTWEVDVVAGIEEVVGGQHVVHEQVITSECCRDMSQAAGAGRRAFTRTCALTQATGPSGNGVSTRPSHRAPDFNFVCRPGEGRPACNAWDLVQDRGRVTERDRDGAATRVTFASSAVTKRELTTESAHIRALRATMTELQLGVVVHSMSGAILMRMCNPAAVASLGLSEEEMNRRKATDHSWQCFHADGSPWLPEDRPVMVTLRTRQPVHNARMVFRKPDGSFAWISADTYIVSVDGTGTAAVAMADLQLYREIFEDSPVGIIYLDAAGQITSVSGSVRVRVRAPCCAAAAS